MMLENYLAHRDVPCPSCKYNLRGLASAECPECNQPLALRVNLVEPRVGAWVAALSGLLAGAGAALVCLLLVAYFSFAKGFPPGRVFFPLVVLPTMVLLLDGFAALALGSWRGRKWFRGLAPGAQSTLIAASWGFLFIAVVVFAIAVD
jgi:hypothetical protein